MTDSPSEPDIATVEDDSVPADPAADLAGRIAEIVGAERWSADHGTVKVHVGRDRWREAVRLARDEAGLPFFGFLSAVDWSRDTIVGEGPADPDETEERYEVICRLASVTSAAAAHLCTDVPKDDPVVDSIVDVFGGASWHERECAEMFGIDFRGHPRLIKLYLPDAFEGHPLRKSYPLLSREVKPWPGTVDVEDLPSTENAEAAAAEGGDE